LLNEVLFFGILKYVCDIVVKKFTLAISSPYEFLLLLHWKPLRLRRHYSWYGTESIRCGGLISHCFVARLF